MRERFLAILPLVWLALGLLLALVVYWPGLHGGFLFDDFGNLPAIGESGPVENWPVFWRYITSGTADPTGRPLTLLSFLLDARNWPADPYPFKRTSLILHLLNGVLLTVLLWQLGRIAFNQIPQRRIEMAAVLGAALWLLHPLFVSTTLYVVQREAMLPTTFTLLGLLLWLRGREAVQRGCTANGLIWIALGLGGCTVLGVLSKANGILLPALALVIEYVLLPHARQDKAIAIEAALTKSCAEPENTHLAGQTRRVYRQAMGFFGWLPALLVAGYLLNSGWNGFSHGVSALRPWTMGQRLLTEPRVLMQYLDLLWLPRPFTPGLFNDQIKASLSLGSPFTTLPCVLAISGLIVGAWLLRRRWPAFALGILFYFVGQSIESTTIPLELYFEHRNYLPAMLMFWPLALWLCSVPQNMRSAPTTAVASFASSARAYPVGRHIPLRADRAKGILAIVLLLGLALMTHARAQLWGNTRDQAFLWATLNPDSPRAQANAALMEMGDGRPQPAVIRLETLLRSEPNQVQLAFNLIGAHCMLGSIGSNDLAQAIHAIAHTRDPGSLLVHWFEGSIPNAVSGTCHGLDLHTLDKLIDAGLANQTLMEVGGRRQDLMYLKGRIALAQQEPAKAMNDFNLALDQDVRPGAALEQAALLGSAGYPREGLAHLEHYESVHQQQALPGFGMPWLHAQVLRAQDYWPKEIAYLRDTLQHDATDEAAHGK